MWFRVAPVAWVPVVLAAAGSAECYHSPCCQRSPRVGLPFRGSLDAVDCSAGGCFLDSRRFRLFRFVFWAPLFIGGVAGTLMILEIATAGRGGPDSLRPYHGLVTSGLVSLQDAVMSVRDRSRHRRLEALSETAVDFSACMELQRFADPCRCREQAASLNGVPETDLYEVFGRDSDIVDRLLAQVRMLDRGC